VTRLLLDPAADFDDPASVALNATLLDPAPTLVRTFPTVDAATVVDLPAPDPASAWRLTVRRSGRILEERTVHFGDVPSVAWAALTDVDPATLQPMATPGPAWDAVAAELQAEIDALPAGGGGTGGGFSGAYADLTGKPTIPATPADIGAEPAGTVDARIADLVDGAPEALDTLKELATQLATDEGAVAALTAAVASKATPADIDAAIDALDLGTAATHDAADFAARTPSLGTRLRVAATMAAVRNSVDLGPITSGGPAISVAAENTDPLTWMQSFYYANGAIGSFRFRGGAPIDDGGWFNTFVRLGAVTQSGATSMSGTGRENTGSAVEFHTDAPVFQIWLAGGETITCMLEVDGRPVSSTPISLAAANPTGLVRIDFGGVRKPRLIRYESYGGLGVTGGVWHNAGDSFWRPAEGLRLAVVGDSLAAGTGSTLPNGTYTHILGKLLGFSDVWNVAIGGTGFVSLNGQNTFGSAQRVADVVAADPDVLLIPASQNDVGQDVTAAALATFRAYRAALPGVPMILGGIHPASTGPDPSLQATEDQVKAAFDAFADPLAYWVPVSRATDTGQGKPWIWGTGTVAAVNQTGNADVFEGADGAHPTQAGHTYLGYRYAQAIRELVLPLIP
jgi:lysophospholipase L1-like esterase